MKITISPYNPDWVTQFNAIKEELQLLLADLNPQIEHFGSTSVPGLAAKPVIDVLLGLDDVRQFDALIQAMQTNPRYIYYEAFNSFIPTRRLFVRLKDTISLKPFPAVYTDLDRIPHDAINHARQAHIHVWQYNCPDWIRHIAFRDYLKAHPTIRQHYQELKQQLSQQEWEHGMEYSDAKNAFIQKEEAKAIEWWHKKSSSD